MKQIKTRLKSKDYKWFGISTCSIIDKYEETYCDDYNDFSICVEIDGRGQWGALFSKLPTFRKDDKSRGLTLYFRGEGKTGDTDAKFFYKLFLYMLGDIPNSYRKMIGETANLFGDKFSEEYLQSKYDETNLQVESEISKQLDKCVESIAFNPPAEVPVETEEQICVMSSGKSDNHNQFLKMLNYLIKPQDNFEKIVLVYTSGNISTNSVETLYEKLSPEDNRCLIYMLTADNTSSAINHNFTVKKKSRMKSLTTLPKQASNQKQQSSSMNSGENLKLSSENTNPNTKSQNGTKDSRFGYLLLGMLAGGLLIGFGLGFITCFILTNKISQNKLDQNEQSLISELQSKYDTEHKQYETLSAEHDKLKQEYGEYKIFSENAVKKLYREIAQILEKFRQEYKDSFNLETTDDTVPTDQTVDTRKKRR